MKKLNTLIIILLFFGIKSSLAGINQDSLKIKEIESQVRLLDNEVKMVQKNQLNYKIEKDLLKETYSNNYERINLIITMILGIIGVFGFLGIRDINTVKKEYRSELSKLKSLQSNFESKSDEFNLERDKIDSEIKEILFENKEQNRKIKFIELKNKIESLIAENKFYDSLDFIGVALELFPKDKLVLRYKARVLCRLNKLGDSLTIHKKIHALYPDDKGVALDLIESMIFAKDFEKSDALIKEYSTEYNERSNGRLAKVLNLFKLYHLREDDTIIKEIKSLIDFDDLDSVSKRIPDWDLEESKFVAVHLKDSLQKEQLQNVIWYMDGQINGRTLCTVLKIDIPS